MSLPSTFEEPEVDPSSSSSDEDYDPNVYVLYSVFMKGCYIMYTLIRTLHQAITILNDCDSNTDRGRDEDSESNEEEDELAACACKCLLV